MVGTLELASRHKGEKGGGELIKWPDCASTRLCFCHHRAERRWPPESVWAEVAAAAGRPPACGWGFLCWGRDLVLATIPHPWRHNKVPWEVSRARRTCEFEASEESLFQGRMYSRENTSTGPSALPTMSSEGP